MSVSNPRLAELIADVQAGELVIVDSLGKTAKEVASCLIELQQLRAAASTPTVVSETIAPGGDERAAARTPPGVAPYVVWEYGVDPSWFHDYWDALAYSEHAAKRPSSVGDSKGNILHRFPRPKTHASLPALSAPAECGHAELAPAADPPTTPLGSAVGGPGTKDPYED